MPLTYNATENINISVFFSYLIEGRDRVQGTVLDCAFNFIAGALLMTAGGNTNHFNEGTVLIPEFPL